MSMGKCLFVEFFGMFWLVLGGCGSVVLVVKFGGDGNLLGIGFFGVVFVFGLIVVIGVYVFGYIFGVYFNLVVSVGLWVGGCFLIKDLVLYIIVQVVGGLLVGFILLQIVFGVSGFVIDGSQVGVFVSNGYGVLLFGGYSVVVVFLCEVVLMVVFLIVIMGFIYGKVLVGFVLLVIGLLLILIYLISILVINILVNLVCFMVVVFFVGSGVVSQLWLFWVVLLLGGVIGGLIYKWIGNDC